jgi:hypothetical protein
LGGVSRLHEEICAAAKGLRGEHTYRSLKGISPPHTIDRLGWRDGYGVSTTLPNGRSSIR